MSGEERSEERRGRNFSLPLFLCSLRSFFFSLSPFCSSSRKRGEKRIMERSEERKGGERSEDMTFFLFLFPFCSIILSPSPPFSSTRS